MTTTRFWNPWTQINRIHEHLNRQFGDFFSGWADLFGNSQGEPFANVWQGEDGAVIRLHAAGFSPEAFDISVNRNVLTIQGQREEDASEDHKVHRAEFGSTEFEKSLQLPFEPDRAKTEARYAHGVLEIRVFLKEEEQPRRIEVKSA